MNTSIDSPSALVTQAPAAFGSQMRLHLERVKLCRQKAAEMNLPPLSRDPSEAQLNRIEEAYADAKAREDVAVLDLSQLLTAEEKADYDAWLDTFNAERDVEIAARAAEHAEEMGRIEQFA